MIIAITGHRPDKLGGYHKNPITVGVYKLLDGMVRTQKAHDPRLILMSGMALGADTMWAIIARELSLPLIAAIPFEGQDSKWFQPAKDLYWDLRRYADSTAPSGGMVKIVSPGGYSSRKMQARNEWMVDRCDRLVAVFDGSSGDTANCVAYAKGRKTIDFINPSVFR